MKARRVEAVKVTVDLAIFFPSINHRHRGRRGDAVAADGGFVDGVMAGGVRGERRE